MQVRRSSTARVQTRVWHEQYECNTSNTSAAQVRHESDTNDTSATWVKNFDFQNETRENMFSHPTLAIWQMKDYKERNNIILKTTFWQCLIPTPKNVQSAPQILNFVIAKAISKRYTLNCSCKWPCTFPHS